MIPRLKEYAMITDRAPDIDRYWSAIAAALPVFAPDEQRAALALYRELAKGSPVSLEQLAQALKLPVAVAEGLLRRPSIAGLLFPDDRGRIVGFGGLAVAPMHHRFKVDGRTLWTWCALDGLFIPELLGTTARIESPDPATGEIVSLRVAPDGISDVQPANAVMSLLMPDASAFDESAANVMANFCHFVFFFASPASGEQWVAEHPGTFLYPLEEGMTTARRLNQRTFGPELERRAAEER
jgi:alkylmercury lyase